MRKDRLASEIQNTNKLSPFKEIFLNTTFLPRPSCARIPSSAISSTLSQDSLLSQVSVGKLILEDENSKKDSSRWKPPALEDFYKNLETKNRKTYHFRKFGITFANTNIISLFTYTLDEFGWCYFIWMLILTLNILYTIYIIPFRWAFINGFSFSNNQLTKQFHTFSDNYGYYIYDIIVDCVFIIDIIFFQSRTIYISKTKGLQRTRVKNTLFHYLKSYGFFFDALAIFVPFIPEIQFFATNCYHPMVRAARFLKIFRAYQFFILIEKRVKFAQILRQIRCFIQLLFLAHMIGCLFFLYYQLQGAENEGIFARFSYVESSKMNPFLYSFYWGFVLVTNIHNQDRPTKGMQYLFMVFIHFIGSFNMAYLFAVFASSLRTRDWHRNTFRYKSVHARQVFRYYGNIPAIHRQDITTYYDYGSKNHIELLETDILGYFPPKIRLNLTSECYFKLLKRVYLFRELSDSFFKELLLTFEKRIYLPNKCVYTQGDVGNELFILMSGSVSLIEDNNNIGSLKAGQSFGYKELLAVRSIDTHRYCSVITGGYTHCLVLQKRQIKAILHILPEDQEKINRTVHEMEKVFKIQRKRVFKDFELKLDKTPLDSGLKRLIHSLLKIQIGLQVIQQMPLIKRHSATNLRTISMEISAAETEEEEILGTEEESRITQHQKMLQKRSSYSLPNQYNDDFEIPHLRICTPPWSISSVNTTFQCSDSVSTFTFERTSPSLASIVHTITHSLRASSMSNSQSTDILEDK